MKCCIRECGIETTHVVEGHAICQKHTNDFVRISEKYINSLRDPNLCDIHNCEHNRIEGRIFCPTHFSAFKNDFGDRGQIKKLYDRIYDLRTVIKNEL